MDETLMYNVREDVTYLGLGGICEETVSLVELQRACQAVEVWVILSFLPLANDGCDCDHQWEI
jgi:hypothetical protein